jgi:hypothetical protein
MPAALSKAKRRKYQAKIFLDHMQSNFSSCMPGNMIIMYAGQYDNQVCKAI